jgi:hypothetical protein
MKRREFITLLGGAVAAPSVLWSIAARAQQPGLPVVAFVSGRSADEASRQAAAFRKGLNGTGAIEGQNVTVEYHWLDGQYDRLPSLMADVVRRRVAVIATPGNTPSAIAAKAATRTIRSSSALPLTRSAWVWSRILPGQAATPPATIFSRRSLQPSASVFCMSWCQRRFGSPCWSIPPMRRAPSPRCET